MVERRQSDEHKEQHVGGEEADELGVIGGHSVLVKVVLARDGTWFPDGVFKDLVQDFIRHLTNKEGNLEENEGLSRISGLTAKRRCSLLYADPF